MPLRYQVGNSHFGLSYQDLKRQHIEFCALSDMAFLDKLPSIIHLSCIICFLKETPTEDCLRDDGIIHQLVHLLDDVERDNIKHVKELFKQHCKLD